MQQKTKQQKEFVQEVRLAETSNQLTSILEDNIERYHLPLCFDPGEEQRELYRRHLHCRDVAERYFRRYKQSK